MTERFDDARRISMMDAIRALPGPEGQRSAELLRHGSLRVRVYAPVGTDPQEPHSQDEIYVVMRGSGTWVSDAGRQRFQPGDFLFAPAGVVHRFEDFTVDFTVWVFFYGPEGGEKGAAT